MKLSDIEYGKGFSYGRGGTIHNAIKSNRIEGGLRICFNSRGEVIDLPEDMEVGFPLQKLNEEE
jgi:hypothetical protein